MWFLSSAFQTTPHHRHMKLLYLHPMALFPSSGALRKFWMMGAIAVIKSESTRLITAKLASFQLRGLQLSGKHMKRTPKFSPCIHKSPIST
jgi:hypothetical protein